MTSQAQPSPSHIRSLYRRILRELPSRSLRPINSAPLPLSSTSLSSAAPPTRSHLHTRIRAIFTPPSSTSTPSSSTIPTKHVNKQLALASQFASYAAAQRQYLYLLERYNPGIGGWWGTEEERVRLSAKRVGVEMPIEYHKEDDGKG